MASEVKNILVNYIHDQELIKYAQQYLSGRLIDIGCGTKPYIEILAPYVSEHLGLEHENTCHDRSNVDLWGTAYNIPAEDGTFDSALCTAVLEHLEEPELAVKECCRVIKKGGIAIYSVPFIWHLHEEPRDFYRYSKYGLKYLFEKAGFEIIEIKALSGFWVTFGQLFIYNVYRLNQGRLKSIPIIPAISLGIQGISYLLDKVDKTEQWTWMYMVIARKT